jgi:hypothetical protein
MSDDDDETLFEEVVACLEAPRDRPLNADESLDAYKRVMASNPQGRATGTERDRAGESPCDSDSARRSEKSD